MRVRELVLVAALSGCVTNLDPRQPSVQMMEREGFGGYIVLSTSSHVFTGELISVEPDVVRVRSLLNGGLTSVPYGEIKTAKLFTYAAEGYYGAWGLVGTLTTISHGLFLMFSAPVWIVSASVAAASESRHVVLEWPDDSWRAFADWARFPQGMPRGLDPRALEGGWVPPPPPAPQPPPVIAPPPGPSPDEIRIQKRQEAWELTKQASDAARRGDCAFVLATGEKVKALDPTFYDAPFATDVGIRACLDAPPATAP